MFRSHTSSLLLAGAVAVMGACGANDGLLSDPSENASTSQEGAWTPSEHPAAGPLHPDTLLVEEDACFEDVDVPNDREVLTFFYRCESGLEAIAAGRIVAGARHGGYLRRVVATELSNPTTLVAWTEVVTLAEAVTEVELHGQWDFGAREIIDFSGESLATNSSSRVTIQQGRVQIDPKLELDIDFGFLSARSVRAVLTVGMTIDIDAVFETIGEIDVTDRLELGTIVHPLSWHAGLLNGGGTLHLVLGLEVDQHGTGSYSRQTLVTSTSGEIEVGGTYDKPDSWETHWVPGFQGEGESIQPMGEGEWHGEASIVVDAKIELDGVDGSTFFVAHRLTGSSAGDCDERSWSHKGEVEAGGDLKLSFFDGAPRDEPLPEYDLTLHEEEGSLVPDEILRQQCEEGPEPWLWSEDNGLDSAGTAAPGNDEMGSEDNEGSLDEVSGECAPAATISCGETVLGDTSMDSLASNNMDGYPCNVGNYSGPELVYSWTANTAGPVEFRLIDPRPLELDHDLFVLDGAGSVCSSSTCLANGANAVFFDAEAGHDYFFVVDGYDGDVGPFEALLDCSP